MSTIRPLTSIKIRHLARYSNPISTFGSWYIVCKESTNGWSNNVKQRSWQNAISGTSFSKEYKNACISKIHCYTQMKSHNNLKTAKQKRDDPYSGSLGKAIQLMTCDGRDVCQKTLLEAYYTSHQKTIWLENPSYLTNVAVIQITNTNKTFTTPRKKRPTKPINGKASICRRWTQ